MRRWTFLFCALLLMATAPVANAQLYLRLVGATQGPIDGDVVFGPLTGTVLTNSFSLGTTTLIDPVSGLPTGQMIVTPLSLMKLSDSASVRILHAMHDGELLSTCTLDAYWDTGSGSTQLTLRLTLSGARIEVWNGAAGFDGDMSENLSISFDTLEWHDYITGDIYTYTMGSTSVVGPLNKDLALATAPNPTSGQTRFAFRVPESGNVSIQVYDARGRRVATVFDGEIGAQTGVVSWDGRDASGRPVASGIYLVKMRAGAWLTTQKMSVLR